MRLRDVIGLSLLALLGWAVSAQAVPSVIMYQGALSDHAGEPLTGTYAMTFGLYAGEAGGAPLWSQSMPIPVTNGVFTVLLGGPAAPLPEGLPDCNYLEVVVDGTPMLPRHHLASVLYALETQNASTLGGQPPSFYLDAGNLSGSLSGACLPDGVIGAAQLADGAVTGPKIAADAVTGDKVRDGSLTGGDLAADAVSEVELANNAVDRAAIQDGAVNGLKIELGSLVSGTLDRWPFAAFGAENASVVDGSRGLRGECSGSAGSTIGVEGISRSTDGIGVVGKGTVGVEGRSDHVGVNGYANCDSGAIIGVRGEALRSRNGVGVYGEAYSCGVKGRSTSSEAGSTGVYGVTPWGEGTCGVHGLTYGPESMGVRGIAAFQGSGLTYGLWGRARSNRGVGAYGRSDGGSGTAVLGEATATSGRTYGVRARVFSDLGTGVYGYAEATSGQTRGVWGKTSSPDGTGVYGDTGAALGRARGVWGKTSSPDGTGVYGSAEASSGQTRGVWGKTSSPDGAGVYGEAMASSGHALGVYGVTYSPSGSGVIGRAVVHDADGVTGSTSHANGHGVAGYASGEGGAALYGRGRSGAYGLRVVEGPVRIQDGAMFWGDTSFFGKVHFLGGTTLGDLAENRPSREVEAGDVVVIGPNGTLVKCERACDSAVAGIISTQPSMLVGGMPHTDNSAPLALVGVVPCKVDATHDAIRAGDLLVSSSTPGHAMKAPRGRVPAGTVVGKALEDLKSGRGTIDVLVTLR
jgi:hypothetical protein